VKVSSPIGELPFEPHRLRVSRHGVTVEGSMGAWPAHVHLDANDLPALIRVLPLRTLGIAAIAAGLVLATRRGPLRRRIQ
jgi:hypothetical protein